MADEFDPTNPLERLRVMNDVQKVIEALEVALDGLAWYADRDNYSHEDFENIPGWWEAPGVFAHDDGERARETIKKIAALVPEQNVSTDPRRRGWAQVCIDGDCQIPIIGEPNAANDEPIHVCEPGHCRVAGSGE